MQAQGSVLTNKYAEGYPGKRYYGGCEFVDVVETLAIDRAKQLFGAEHANVQPHSGAQANMAVYFSPLRAGRHDPGHGPGPRRSPDARHRKVNFSGMLLQRSSPTACGRDTEPIDYDQLAALAREHKPKLIVAGASAYPRQIRLRASSPRLPARSARSSWSTWPTTPAWSPPGCYDYPGAASPTS